MGVVVVSFVLDSSKILFLAKDAHLSCAFIKRKQTVHTNIRIYVGPMQKKNHSSVQARCKLGARGAGAMGASTSTTSTILVRQVSNEWSGRQPFCACVDRAVADRKVRVRARVLRPQVPHLRRGRCRRRASKRHRATSTGVANDGCCFPRVRRGICQHFKPVSSPHLDALGTSGTKLHHDSGCQSVRCTPDKLCRLEDRACVVRRCVAVCNIHGTLCQSCTYRSLQNAMTSSEQRTSAEAEGYRIEGSPMDCVATPRRRGATQFISVLEQILGC